MDQKIFLKELESQKIVHGFFGQKDGKSQGHFQSLNGSDKVGDDVEAVKHNRMTALHSLGAETAPLVMLNQVHGSHVYQVSRDLLSEALLVPPTADGSVTREPGVCLGIVTADCAPVLWVDAHARVIGACHAGWRGVYHAILENTCKEMESLGAKRSNIQVAVGPMIEKHHYRVDQAFKEMWVTSYPWASEFFVEIPHAEGFFYFDLRGSILKKLSQIGIEQIFFSEKGTFEGDFFSYRRARLKEEVNGSMSDFTPCGRNMSLLLMHPYP